jgi:glycosyltransferase involved in cell wall biosynthesis
MIFEKRAQIGIPFNYDENWIGGTYYIKNLISGLNLLPDFDQPDLYILSHELSSYEFIKKETNYKRLNWLKPSTLTKVDGAFSKKLKYLSLITPSFLKKKKDFDLIFPYPINSCSTNTACWIPDFQDKRLPEFFSGDEISTREKQHRSYFENHPHIVFSSEAAKSDFEHYYPEAYVEKHVLHFSVFEDKQHYLNEQEVLNKHEIKEAYFYCPNQFWIHKNHRLVIDAVYYLKSKGINVFVCFSGKEHDHRAPDYSLNLKKMVQDLGLVDNIKFLGFLPRDEQLIIFKNAIAIIQPSKFEGWSTVIEDAKSLSKYVLASSISANLEQIKKNVDFFGSDDVVGLSNLIVKCLNHDVVYEEIDYKAQQLEFALSFMALVAHVRSVNKRLH